MVAGNSNYNLVLAGFMGGGKSTVGRLAASSLGWPLVDTDSAIEAEVGLPVREIFARYGEQAFRQHECEICRRVAGQRGQVVALGGGTLLDAANRAALEASGVIVLLGCAPGILVQRLRISAENGERPLLQEKLEVAIAKLLEERATMYSSIPLKVDTSYLAPEQVAREVLDLFAEAMQPNIEVNAL